MLQYPMSAEYVSCSYPSMKPVVINTFGLLPSAWVLPLMSEDVDRSTLQISLLGLPETVAGAAAAHVRHVLRQHQATVCAHKWTTLGSCEPIYMVSCVCFCLLGVISQ